MRYDALRHEIDGDVVRLTLARPAAGNALSAQMRVELIHALAEAPAQGRAVAIGAMGRDFCAGQDLGGEPDLTEADLGGLAREDFAPLLRAIEECAVPVVTMVRGVAAGAGAALALAADICVAARSASFAEPSLRAGLTPIMGASWLLPRLAGRARALGMALLGDPVPAARALEWGLIWEMTEDDALEPRGMEISRRLAAGPAEAIRLTRAAVRAGAQSDLETQLEREARALRQAGRTRDALEGLLALREGRPPRFEGR
ncbi:enoyl-CoA hydratase-related protein [Oceanicella actignis]|uniref:2-(1,2-epoxy-1,2-dihydrophenyl)acetyl-CoA isomerase n=1 Tax=Oceanicella actignis TaxID=1189325 RepID=A0A1M7S235_9RHOB|nr:enoyl-CoA hydratase-related protein [Oceanicella actignis]SES90315.1 2-(1,2-epoxy-1,2-dihydrophenyl)acetyl-CoA isomerase [Oceanicella actignis]SHN52677.1 2-(1,2-epoxy-1,2-dihydrophenyl)acetyl-CoA isomerase [Oceanicella actignis]